MKPIYLDNNATTEPLSEVTEVVLEGMRAHLGNPSSTHALGRRTKALVERGRNTLAGMFAVDPSHVVFTASATEANNMVLRSAYSRNPGRARIITTAVEHSSVLKTAQQLQALGCDAVYLPVDSSGRVSPEALESALCARADLVSVQWVNSETGVIQPIRELGGICRRHEVPFHVDAAQAVGRVEVGTESAWVDYVTLSGHKLHAPLGVGALTVRDSKQLEPLLTGGEQENGLRAGTENVPGILGLAKACELRMNTFEHALEHMAHLRDRFEAMLRGCIAGLKVNGGSAPRVCNTSNLMFPDIDGQALVAQLDARGIYCSQTSACVANRPEPSYVLRAMGLSEDDAYRSVRFSVSVLNTLEEIETAVVAIEEIYSRLVAFARL